MSRKLLLAIIASVGLTGSSFAATTPEVSIGVVNFATCIADSKLGKKEQESFEALKKQMASLVEDTEKQMNEIATKFNDPEYLDGLSPEAEEELKIKFRTLNEELNRYQNQYYQVLNQANMKLIQMMSVNINTAAEKIAKEKKLGMVINKEAFFFYSPTLDVTPAVIAEMDKTFELESKKTAAAPAPATNAPTANNKAEKAPEKAEVKTK